MTMSDDEKHDVWGRVRDAYNVPTEAPREEMWSAISARLGRTGDEERRAVDAEVHDLADARRRLGGSPAGSALAIHRVAGWAVAAAAVLVIGIGIGRMSAPAPVATGPAASPTAGTPGSGVQLAAREHLGRTESLLTLVRADGRDGRVEPAVAGWAEDLLAQTRLLLDRPGGVEPEVRELLMDLELVLVQVAGAARAGSAGNGRARTEVELTLRSLDEGEVLSRIQAVLPDGMLGA